ncbi:protein brambleberry isoform X2 [Tribolium castaneum]|uniref:protein brambleberry isoform X2 n=1 Tax=Tribolium castaneum TaxID=7070 RepID=UPI00046C003F
MLILLFFKTWQVQTGFTDYVKTIGSYFTFTEPESDSVGEFVQRIPYEVSTVDEKFISEAAKLTGVALSELDSCQQRVVLKLRSDCDKMNDEQLAKMAVHLLNCQSYVEGRPIFPCTDDMSIRDCTGSMDSDTWTSYHLMSNRARAVCYTIRQMQFRGMAEHSINRLMDTARDQLKTLGKIAENQQDLHDIAEQTLSSLAQGHEILTNQQRDIQRAQFHGQLVLEDNIRKLSQEKELIVDTHNQLVQMTHKIQRRLEDSSKNLEKQRGETRQNHEELLDDLVKIQDKAHAIFERIEESSRLLFEQNQNFKTQYEETLRNLAEVNRTVHNLVTLVGGTRQALEERLMWLTTALGGTDLAVERLYLIIWHAAFILISMLTCAFLSARLTTRLIVATLPPVNLGLALWGSPNQLGPLTLLATILSLVLGHVVMFWALALKVNVRGRLPWRKEPQKKPEQVPEFDLSTNLESEELDDFNLNSLGSPTPPHSRSGFYRPRSRSNTPLVLNGSARGVCHAKTRVGTPCKLASLPGRDFCYRHQTGDSVMG